MKHWIGIDPGFSGVFCTIKEHDKQMDVSFTRMPVNKVKQNGVERNQYDFHGINIIFEQIATIKDAFVTLEHMQPLPEMIRPGGNADFYLGECRGLLKAYLVAYDISHKKVVPRIWQKAMFNDMLRGDTKDRSLAAAKKVFPDVDLIPPGGRVPNHNYSDALLIAEYGRKYCSVNQDYYFYK